jgi:cysteine desulfuration protein SufE
VTVATKLDSIVDEMSEADAEERKEILIDFAKSLPALPERFIGLKDSAHRVHECQSPVFLFIELAGDHVAIHADAPIEAPTVRGFVSLLVEGLSGSSVEDVLAVRSDLIARLGLPEILGMLRLNGLSGVLHRLKSEVSQAVAARS